MSSEVGGEPSDDDWRRGEHAGKTEEESKVLDTNVGGWLVRVWKGDEDDESNESHSGWDHNEDKSFAKLVGKNGGCESKYPCESPDWDCADLSHEGVNSPSLDDSWAEISDW